MTLEQERHFREHGYLPLRRALTGRESGPEMAGLVEAIGKEKVVARLEAAAKR